MGRAIPDGAYEVGRDAGWGTVGRGHDPATCAVAGLRRWWQAVGRGASPGAERPRIRGDGGGSTGERVRLWKVAVQRCADTTGLAVTGRHLPPGTSTWNTIAHRPVAQIGTNWRGRPLVSHEVIGDLIGATTTAPGRRVQAALDPGDAPTKVTVSDDELATVHPTPHALHGERNYTVTPRHTHAV